VITSREAFVLVGLSAMVVVAAVARAVIVKTDIAGGGADVTAAAAGHSILDSRRLLLNFLNGAGRSFRYGERIGCDVQFAVEV